MEAMEHPDPAEFAHISRTLESIWPAETRLLGIILFGSRAKFRQQRHNADWDVGIIYSGPEPHLDTPEGWDLFLWNAGKWDSGFALQVEVARNSIILLDETGIIADRFAMIRERILPFWGGYLQRF